MSELRSVHLEEPGLRVVEHELDVPLDHGRPDGEQITVFGREVVDPDGADRPYLLFLQGGPGGESPRPGRRPTSPGWLDRALQDFRVLLLDQRGTGRSTPIGPATLTGRTATQVADHLARFRADSIVADAELLRAALGIERWSLLGQSFGGFCSLTYLSTAPEALDRVLFTGGVPPIGARIDEVYAATYARMRERNARHHARYPGDLARLRVLLDRTAQGTLLLPGGQPVTTARLRSIGNVLGMSDGSGALHHLLERDPDSPAFGHDLAAMFPFSGRSPLYALLQEACYADGGATRWAADRCLPDDFASDETLLFGEHCFGSTYADDPELAPWAEAAELLAQRTWPRVYDADVLAAQQVPCAAAVYADDPYVERVLSQETAEIAGIATWVTPDLDHNALRAAGGEVLDRLLGMTRGEPTPAKG